MSADEAAERVARDFIARYETAWAQGAQAAAQLYTADSVLVGYMTAIGRAEIQKLLVGVGVMAQHSRPKAYQMPTQRPLSG
jgi:hypothetical protein